MFACCPHTQVVGVASTFTGVWVEVAGLIAELDVLAGSADLATTCTCLQAHYCAASLLLLSAPLQLTLCILWPT
jgi:acetaldehyde dehydrogenase (acetylating)